MATAIGDKGRPPSPPPTPLTKIRKYVFDLQADKVTISHFIK